MESCIKSEMEFLKWERKTSMSTDTQAVYPLTVRNTDSELLNMTPIYFKIWVLVTEQSSLCENSSH